MKDNLNHLENVLVTFSLIKKASSKDKNDKEFYDEIIVLEQELYFIRDLLCLLSHKKNLILNSDLRI